MDFQIFQLLVFRTDSDWNRRLSNPFDIFPKLIDPFLGGAFIIFGEAGRIRLSKESPENTAVFQN